MGKTQNLDSQPESPNLFKLLNKVYLRSPDAITSEIHKLMLERGEFDNLLDICLPDDIESYKDILTKVYPIHQIIAHLIYIRWEKHPLVTLEKLEEVIKARLKKI